MNRTKMTMMILNITLVIVVCLFLTNMVWQKNSMGHKPFSFKVFGYRMFYSDHSNASEVQHCTVYNLTQPPSRKQIQCVKLKIDKPTTMLCHSPITEDLASKHYVIHGMDEGQEVAFIMETLQKNPEMGLIDIGTNLGVYSLVVAMMGHKVVSVEPNPDNYLRFHESVYLQRLEDKVTLITNPIGGTRTLMTIIQNPIKNKADTRMHMTNQPCNHTLNATHLCSVTLPDLLEVISFDSAILKMDCQGYEVQAMRKAAALLDKIRIPYIQLEWQFVRLNSFKRSDNTNLTEHVRLVQNLIKLLVGRKYTPYGSPRTKVPLNTSLWQKWRNVNVWWKLQEG